MRDGENDQKHRLDPPTSGSEQETLDRDRKLNANHSDGNENHRLRKVDRKYRNSRLGEVIMVIATVVIAISTSVYMIFAIKQWGVMSDTLAQMKASGEESTAQTNRIITEANRIADSMKETLRQSKASLDTTINNFHLEQRAWVGVVGVSAPKHKDGERMVFVKEGEPMKAEVIIKNSGRTPALNMRTTVAMFYRKSTDKLIPTYKTVGTKSTTVLQPNGESILRAPPIPVEGTINKADIANMSNGHFILYIAGKITYDNVFGRSHSTLFCQFLDHTLTTFNSCEHHNNAD